MYLEIIYFKIKMTNCQKNFDWFTSHVYSVAPGSLHGICDDCFSVLI